MPFIFAVMWPKVFQMGTRGPLGFQNPLYLAGWMLSGHGLGAVGEEGHTGRISALHCQLSGWLIKKNQGKGDKTEEERCVQARGTLRKSNGSCNLETRVLELIDSTLFSFLAHFHVCQRTSFRT